MRTFVAYTLSLCRDEAHKGRHKTWGNTASKTPHLPRLECSGEIRKSRLLGWRSDVQQKRLNSLAQYAMMLATWKECIYAGFNILNRMSVLLLITVVGGALCCR